MKKKIKITSIKQLEEMSSAGGGAYVGHSDPKKDLAETLLRKHIRSRIQTLRENQNKQELLIMDKKNLSFQIEINAKAKNYIIYEPKNKISMTQNKKTAKKCRKFDMFTEFHNFPVFL